MVLEFISNSQFPLWDFFECNGNRPVRRPRPTYRYTLLSIPFVGFLRMQREPYPAPVLYRYVELSIPFVGFLRMQHLR